MTRTLDPVLRQGLERANPATCDIVEISAPDATTILRRANDQFFTNPPRVSETPGASSAADANGHLILAPTNFEQASFYNTSLGGEANILDPDVTKSIKGAGWTIDPAYGRAILKKFTARIRRTETTPVDLQLQIYRPKLQRMFYRDAAGNVVETSQVTFLQVLPQPVVTRYATLTWSSNFADVVFDLSQVRPEVGPGPILGDPLGTALAQNPPYVFVVSTVNPPKAGIFRWMLDEVTANDVAGVGRFQEMEFGRPKPEDRWAGGVAVNNFVEAFKLEIERYAATSTIIYAITLPSVPIAASSGRAVFERATPPGTAATLELSTAGSGGPWTAVKHGDAIAAKQLTYHLRLVMTSPASLRLTPRVAALGIDFRIPVDVSAEVLMDPLAHEIQLPYCEAGIGEGRATVVRAGRRDYRDIASDLAIRYPTSKLELDHYIGSRHPKITRDRWFHLERAPVTNREPTETSETFSLLSPLKALKRKVPAKVETINKVHTVIATTTASQVRVTPALDGAAGTGDYLGQGYYMRVRTTAVSGVVQGTIHTINNNTGTDRLDFSPALPFTLLPDDVIEVHSAQFTQPVVEWIDEDPADIWVEVFADLLGIPAERIGFAGLGQASRSGLPPKVTDRAPGDATTQAKLKVTIRLKPEENGDELIDQLSFILGGCTIDVAGQFVFRQIYPLRDANGQVTVPTATPTKVFDHRDYTGLLTPVGLEQRITQLSCDYGVNTTLQSDETQAPSTVVFVDADAMTYLAPQDVEGLGRGTIAKEISRWLYNSADEGRLLAEQLARQVVDYASTGLRVWPFTAIDAHPEVHIGDAVWIVTDQYTDFDPRLQQEIRGAWAFPGIIVSVQAGGRRFRALIPGLGSAVLFRPTRIAGGDGPLAPELVEAFGPSLDVNATPGASTFTINYTVDADTFEYSVDGAAFTIVPATGFTVTRPAAGAADRTLTFRATKNGQTVTNTITVPAIDKDTVTPDLVVTQTAQTETTTSFQVTASNPGGGAAPTITFSLVNTSAQGYSGAGPHAIASGTTVVIDRPTLSSNQATVKFRATIAGSGAEEISRTIPNTAYDPGTDVENMVENGGGQTGALSAQAPGWTFGQGSSLIVAADRARFGDRSLRIFNTSALDSYSYQDHSVVDGGFYELSAWIETDSMSGAGEGAFLNVSAVSGVTGFTVLEKVGASPSGAANEPDVGIAKATPTVSFTLVRSLFRVTGTGTIRIHTQLGYNGTLTGVAWFDGVKLRRVPRTQPNLRVWAVEGSTSYTVYYEVDPDAVVVYRTDNGSDSTPPASGFTVSRNAFGGAAKVLTFTATRAGHTEVVSIAVPPQADPAAGITANVDSLFWVSTDYVNDQISMRFAWSGAIGGGAFRMYRIVSSGTSPDMSGTQTLIYNSSGASPVTVVDQPSVGDIQSGAGPKMTFSYQVRVVDTAGNVLRSSEWVHRIETVV